MGLEFGDEFADGFFEDTSESAAPAGVNGSDGSFFGVDEKDRDTVGSSDAEEEAGSVGE